jgi:hypothetical protein
MRGLCLAVAVAVAAALVASSVANAQTEPAVPAYDLKLNNNNDAYSNSNAWKEMQSACRPCPGAIRTPAYSSAL